MIPAHASHSYRPDESEEEWDLGFVAFNGRAADAMLEQMGELLLSKVEVVPFDNIWGRLEALWQLLSQGGERMHWEASKRMYDILLSMMEGQYPAPQKTKRIYPAGQPSLALRSAVQLIHNHYNERLLLSNVARAAGYSIQHFHRLFVASFGVTPQQYIVQLRMRRSLQLLEENQGMTVERIAESLGMDTSYFIRMFKRTYGITPKQFAKGRSLLHKPD